ncbi:hypothetical protein FE257_003818 [Aspergillus nanangensis]|uniref:Protein HRI1 n=1 Tax=Aspergillus nanangensis TaxID=2582783 RepID=A0AAD4CCJ7_ASPNN|nr:hypothetical protein FE257_003818 [Aspergillus nanangensis]
MASDSPNPSSQSRLSTRISLRWIPEPASETTDTIVMSVTGWFVDLRVDRKSGAIDWAIAGERVVDSKEPRRVQFTHEIDSHNSFDAVDCGTFTTLPNSDDLETGSMPRPDLPGAPIAEYEEVWRELAFQPGPDDSRRGLSWVLESYHPETADPGHIGEIHVQRIFLARIWGTYLALSQRQTLLARGGASTVKEGGEVSARREEWDSTTGWTVKYDLGPGSGSPNTTLPSMDDFGDITQSWQIGEVVGVRGGQYMVRAWEEVL